MFKWKLFCWVVTVLTVGSVSSQLVLLGFSPSVLIGAFISLFLLLPYIGYAYEKKIINPAIWKVTFALQLILLLLIGVFAAVTQFFYSTGGGNFTGGLFGTLLVLPIGLFILIPPYLYAFKSKKLWETNV
ncbi:hypothetical protein M2H05_22405 [Vibrio vulnificus]|nr:hypothetical protein [Vibrio vulnificus]